jgi:hypothetical protein
LEQGLIITEQPRLTSVALVRRFPAEDVRRAQFVFEDEFKDLIGGQTTPLNLPPNPPPEAPRFMMTDGKRTLVVSNTSVQLTLDFGGALPPKMTLQRALERPARVMDDALGRVFANQKRFYGGIVVVWSAKQMDLERLSAELVEWIMKPHFEPQLASFSCTIGLERKGSNRTIEISQYKAFRRQATAVAGAATISVDPDFEPADDKGLQIKIDVNTKPQISTPLSTAFESLIPVISDTIQVELAKLVGPKLTAALPQ